jgi:hypothetical protein
VVNWCEATVNNSCAWYRKPLYFRYVGFLLVEGGRIQYIVMLEKELAAHEGPTGKFFEITLYYPVTETEEQYWAATKAFVIEDERVSLHDYLEAKALRVKFKPNGDELEVWFTPGSNGEQHRVLSLSVADIQEELAWFHTQ